MGILEAFAAILWLICVALMVFMVLVIVVVVALFLYAAINQVLFSEVLIDG